MRRAIGFAALAALLPGASAGPARAAEADLAPPDLDAHALLERADALGLARTLGWRRLLHVPGAAPDDGRGGPASHADDPAFFVDERGWTDPATELAATVHALFGTAPPPPRPLPPGPGPVPSGAPPVGTDDPARSAHPRCRFVARERWLRERLELPAAEVPPGCAAYHRWRARLNAHSATLVFPAAYLNNPSSMFGHTLLRLDPPDVAEGSDWLSWSVNFAADTGEASGQGPLFVWRGLTGGYPGRFSLAPYFTTLRDYGAIENRDIWEYPLDLTPAEIDRLVQHLWELQGVSFDYYYLRQNCSFRLLELIEQARPSLDLVSGFPVTAIPADTVRAVSGAGLIEGARWVPSAQTLLRHGLGELSDVERARVDALVDDPETGADDAFAALPAPSRARVVAAADRLLTYRARREAKTPDGARRRLAMLTLLAEHGGGAGGGADIAPIAGRLAAPPRPSSPDIGHATTLASLGLGSESGLGHVELGLRASYHDLIDPPAGYVPGSAISLAELRLRALEGGEARVESFAAVGLRSLAPSVPGMRSISWGADIGLVRDRDVERGRLIGRVAGLGGFSRAFGARSGGPRGIGYALAGPSLDALDRRGAAGWQARLNAHARLGLLVYGRFGATRVELGADSLDGRSVRLAAQASHDWPFAVGRSLRASAAVSELGGVRRETVSVALRVHF